MLGPLSDLRVIELGHALAGPFASVLLADFGADVVKIEPPGTGDSLRCMGPSLTHSSVWWSVTGRNKKSVAVDFKTTEGLQIVLDLMTGADIVVENFRPGVLERAGLDWHKLSKLNPRLIMLRISGFGQDGPYSSRRGFGKIAEAFSGATNLTGHPDDSPVHPGYSLGDTTTGLMGAFGVLLALYERNKNGRGQVIDLPLYEPLFRMIEWQLPLYNRQGEAPTRAGSSFPFDGAFITDICPTKDGSHIVVSAATSAALARLRNLLYRDGVIDEASVPNGSTSGRQLVDALRTWASRHTRDEALRSLENESLVAGSVYTVEDIINDEHVAARKNVVYVPVDGGGEVPMPCVVPRLSSTPGEIRWTGPRLGAHTDEVLRDILHMPDERIDELRAQGVIA